MAAALLGHLVLDVYGGNTGALHLTNGTGNVQGAAPTGVDIHEQRKVGGRGDAARVFDNVVHGGHAEIRKAEGGVSHAPARQVDGPVAGLLGHHAAISVDGSDDLQGLLGQCVTESPSG